MISIINSNFKVIFTIQQSLISKRVLVTPMANDVHQWVLFTTWDHMRLRFVIRGRQSNPPPQKKKTGFGFKFGFVLERIYNPNPKPKPVFWGSNVWSRDNASSRLLSFIVSCLLVNCISLTFENIWYPGKVMIHLAPMI